MYVLEILYTDTSLDAAMVLLILKTYRASSDVLRPSEDISVLRLCFKRIVSVKHTMSSICYDVAYRVTIVFLKESWRYPTLSRTIGPSEHKAMCFACHTLLSDRSAYMLWSRLQVRQPGRRLHYLPHNQRRPTTK